MLRYSVALAAAAFASTLAAAPPSPDPKSLVVPDSELSKARELVQKLGNASFMAREEAERDLAAMGRFARVALLEGVSSDPNAEIRARCRILLPKATHAEMKARLDTFVADTDGTYDHDLPGWPQLRAVTRGEWRMFGWTLTARPDADKGARELFIEFMQAPGGRKLLAALDGPPAELGQMVAARKAELHAAAYPRGGRGTRRTPTASEVGVLLFAESQVNSRRVPRAVSITSVLTASGLPGAVRGTDDRAHALRAVMTAWFNSRTDAAELYTAMSLANTMQDNDAIGRLAARIMTTPGTPAYYKGQALHHLVRLKLTHHLPDIEGAFTDATALTTVIKVVNGVRERQAVEVRDAALAAALVLTNQSPEEYGFDKFPPGGATFIYTHAKLADDKRNAAFEKWKAWRKKNP